MTQRSGRINMNSSTTDGRPLITPEDRPKPQVPPPSDDGFKVATLALLVLALIGVIIIAVFMGLTWAQTRGTSSSNGTSSSTTTAAESAAIAAAVAALSQQVSGGASSTAAALAALQLELDVIAAATDATNTDPASCKIADQCSGQPGKYNVGVRFFSTFDPTYQTFALYNQTLANIIWPANQRYRQLMVLYPTTDASGQVVQDFFVPYLRGILPQRNFSYAGPRGYLFLANASLPCAQFDGVIIPLHGSTTASSALSDAASFASSGRIVVITHAPNEYQNYGILSGYGATAPLINSVVARQMYLCDMQQMDAFFRPFYSRASFNWVITHGQIGNAAKTSFSSSYSGNVVVSSNGADGTNEALIFAGVTMTDCTSLLNNWSIYNGQFCLPSSLTSQLCSLVQRVGGAVVSAPSFPYVSYPLWALHYNVNQAATVPITGYGSIGTLTGVIVSEQNWQEAPLFVNAIGSDAFTAELGQLTTSVFYTQSESGLYILPGYNPPLSPYEGTQCFGCCSAYLYNSTTFTTHGSIKVFAQSIGTDSASFDAIDICVYASTVAANPANGAFLMGYNAAASAALEVAGANSYDGFYDGANFPLVNDAFYALGFGWINQYMLAFCPSGPISGTPGPNSIPPWNNTVFPPIDYWGTVWVDDLFGYAPELYYPDNPPWYAVDGWTQPCQCSVNYYASSSMQSSLQLAKLHFADAVSRGCGAQSVAALATTFSSEPSIWSRYAISSPRMTVPISALSDSGIQQVSQEELPFVLRIGGGSV
jgi:hypothetical protein